ncbi:TIGR03617 family F420-dependent LLM class oxidoreductase [Nocardioides sp. zg-ZUI104]|uniref:TIGR03617 family F420-dependent LLM class oxidoreductase n=1 Tax=Nocardioides faecalis TaxID=2803858 RepID=UPI001BCD657E|nr:TIGR03617 family F420-dependent LLM class oxidoreductase [Nocardioides faecalis]MBS4754560.1 TIGR03617 family F420-dependent LLM class oxidoreductase [Nocardioides faecalis]
MIDVQTKVAAGMAADAEAAGFDGVWATESVTDSTLMAMGAALSTERVHIGTAVTIAFARNPMTLSYAAWDLQAASGGRFTVGLGSQVKAHVERRYSMPWTSPAPRMRDFIGAMRAIWSSWQTGDKLAYEGEHYQHTMMTPVFTPHHHEHPLRIMLSAVGPRMTRLGAEVADGIILHGFTTPEYLDAVTLPTVAEGLAASGRERSDLTLYCPLFLITGNTEEEMVKMREDTRAQIAFYASTPNYRDVLESVGFEDLQVELQDLTREGKWDQLAERVPDELLDRIAVTGEPDVLAGRIHERFGDRLDRISSRFGWPTADLDQLSSLVEELHGDATPTVG